MAHKENMSGSRMPLIRYCFIKSCQNSTEVTPEKHFFNVPPANKAEWCHAAGIDHVPQRALSICEDHLDLEEDVENYLPWKMHAHSRPILKSRLPEFKMHNSTNTKSSDKGITCAPLVMDKETQAHIKMTHRSTNCPRWRKPAPKLQFTEETVNENPFPSLVGTTSTDNYSDTETSSDYIPPKKKNAECRQLILNIIEQKPMTYLGIPKKMYWFIDFIVQNSKKISRLSTIIVLYKIKNNDSFGKIADLFEVSLTTLWRYYYRTLSELCHIFRQFIYWPSALHIKLNLPNAFTINREYSCVQAIIDCFEIEIEKPANPVQQSLTWSQYKSCNTIKYLISATPDGFINFVSKGYGGRISDVNIVEESGFLQFVPQNCSILADRGFKHLETTLRLRNVKLLRPPTVYANVKLSKSEVITSKVIASLRVHIERVIRRVRMFKLLKPHSTVNNKLISTLDSAVIIACGLVNLQTPIIKAE